jgi:uncharacterized protein
MIDKSEKRELKPLHSVLVKPAGPDCNMACTYCFYLKKSRLFPHSKTLRMSEDVLKQTVQQVMKWGEPQVTFAWQGGEPMLMGMDFFKKAVEFQQRFAGHRVREVGNGLQTNGILIDRHWARFLKKYNFLVGLSLDGPQHIHDKYRRLKGGKGSWSRVKDRAGLLLDAGAAVNALTVVNDYSVQFPEEIYDFHKSLGLNYMQFIPCVEPDPGNPDRPAPFSVDPEKFGRFLCRVFDLWMKDAHGTVFNTSIRFFDSVFYRYVGRAAPDCTLQENCGTYVVVEHNGDVYSCDFFVEDKWKLGNVVKRNLLEMLNSPLQETFGQRKANVPDACRECRWFQYCRGGCTKDRLPAGETRSVSYLCQSYKMFFQHAHAAMRELAQKWQSGRVR